MWLNETLGRTLRVGALLVLASSALARAATPLPAAPKGPLSSSFPGPLWALGAPEGGTAAVSNAHLFLRVPGGSNHDALLPANQAVRLVQPIADVNFDVSIKIDSLLVAQDADTRQGLMVLADDRNFVTFSVGTNGNALTLAAHLVTQGKAATLFATPDFPEYQNPLYLRLSRTGKDYLAYYSVDGAVWTQAGRFSSEQTPAWVGPFASNYNANPAKAVPVVMAVNWFDIL